MAELESGGHDGGDRFDDRGQTDGTEVYQEMPSGSLDGNSESTPLMLTSRASF